MKYALIIVLLLVVTLSGCIESDSSPEPEVRYIYVKETPTPVRTPVPTPQPTPKPCHHVPYDELDDPMYVNYNDDVDEHINKVCSEFAEYMPVYMRSEVDCSDMAVYLWNKLQEKGVKTLLVAGTTDGEFTPFDECDHVWLQCRTPTGCITIEPTMPATIYRSGYITYRTSEEIEELIIEQREQEYREIRAEMKILSDDEFNQVWESLRTPEEEEERLHLLQKYYSIEFNDRPDDFPDYSYGFYYAKPSDLRADVGDRW